MIRVEITTNVKYDRQLRNQRGRGPRDRQSKYQLISFLKYLHVSMYNVMCNHGKLFTNRLDRKKTELNLNHLRYNTVGIKLKPT